MTQQKSLKSVALVAVTAAAATFLIQACGGDASAQQASDIDAIEGIWDGSVTAKNCTTGAVTATFKSLLLFNRGGTLSVDASSADRSARGPIAGVWKHGAGTSYTADVVHFRFNPDSTLAGTNKIRRTLTVGADGNSFTSALAVTFLDTAGAVVGQACPTETAVRVTF